MVDATSRLFTGTTSVKRVATLQRGSATCRGELKVVSSDVCRERVCPLIKSFAFEFEVEVAVMGGRKKVLIKRLCGAFVSCADSHKRSKWIGCGGVGGWMKEDEDGCCLDERRGSDLS